MRWPGRKSRPFRFGQPFRFGSSRKIGGGPAVHVRRAPLTYQPACKPGSVGRRANSPRDGHSSGTPVARRLQQPTRTADRGHTIRAFARAAPIRSCSRWGLPCRFRCRKRGALLPHRFTLAAADTQRAAAVCSLWHCPWGCPRRTLSGTVCPGARTFLPGRLSALARSGRPAD